MSLLLPHGEDAGEPLANPFETWCAAVGIDPEDSRAWMLFETNQQVTAVAAGAQAPAAS